MNRFDWVYQAKKGEVPYIFFPKILVLTLILPSIFENFDDLLHYSSL